MDPYAFRMALRRVYELTETYHVPDDCYNKIISFETLIPNYKLLNWESKGFIEVELCKVIGTNYEEYQKAGTWIEMLAWLKKYSPYYKRTFSKGLDPAYYKDVFSSIHYAEHLGSFIIAGDGNNRTCIAKIMGFKTIFANVTSYF